jgi:hypothetical protein
MRRVVPLLLAVSLLMLWAVPVQGKSLITKDQPANPSGSSDDVAALLAGEIIISRVKAANPAEDAYTLAYLLHAPVDVTYAVIKDQLVYPRDRLTRIIISQSPSECIYRDVYPGNPERTLTLRTIFDDVAHTIQGELLADSANLQTSNRFLISVTPLGNAAKVTQSGTFKSTSPWDRSWIDTTESWGIRPYMRRWIETYRLRTAHILAEAMTHAPPQVQTVPEAKSLKPTGQLKRTALIIGNSAYKEGPLKNPVNDARDMAAALRGMGFDVILKENASLAQMESAVGEFWQHLRKGGAGLFYYAGHGLQVNGHNYLVPVDAKLEVEQDVKYKCMDAGQVLGRMDNAGNDLNIIILDACRSNPFARSWRSADQGLAKMDAPKGSIIAYATAPDSVAADGTGRNGLYTEKLLKAMRVPGQPVEQMFKHVRDEVMRSTKDRQVPWESTSLRGDFYFVP